MVRLLPGHPQLATRSALRPDASPLSWAKKNQALVYAAKLHPVTTPIPEDFGGDGI